MGHSEARARSLSDEVFWLRHALEVSKAGKEKLKARLVKLRAAGSKLPCDEATQLRAALRRSRRQKTTLNTLRKENARLHRTVRKLETRKAALEVRPAKLRAIRKALESELAGLRAVGKTLSKSLSVADADLRRALRRSRRQKATIKSLSRENARLRKGAKTSRNRIETLEAQLERLRATGAVLSRVLYGRKSEQQDKPRSERKARPAARRARPRPHPAARARGANRRVQPAAGCVRLRTVRAALCAERRRGIHPRRDRGQGPQAGDPPVALAQGLRVRVVAHGSLGAPGCRGCSPGRSTGPASGRASCSSTVPASAPCTGLPRGSPARGCRSRRGPWPTA